MAEQFTSQQSRKAGGDMTKAILQWAEARVGTDKAYGLTNHIRGLARSATRFADKGAYSYRCQADVDRVREAVEDIEEIYDSIVYKTEHGEEV